MVANPRRKLEVKPNSPPRRCERAKCGKDFTPRRMDQCFCSARCQQLEAQRQFIGRRRAAGLCVRCGKAPRDPESKNRCAKCKEDGRIASANSRAGNLEEVRKRGARIMRGKRAKRRAAGLCECCGKAPRDPKSKNRCINCLKRARTAIAKRRRANGAMLREEYLKQAKRESRTLLQPAQRGPKRDEGKLDLLSCCLDEGLSLNAMRLRIYPETPATAYDNTRQLFSRNRPEIEKRCKPETVLRLVNLFKKPTVT
jgi:hypothetical protein